MPTQTEQIIALAESIAADVKLLANNKVDGVPGKALSTNDYTSPEKTKLGGLSSVAYPSLQIAATMDIGAIDSEVIAVAIKTGSQAITSFGTAPAGTKRTLIFSANSPNKTITYNATSMILPAGVNLAVTLGAAVTVVSLGGGNWRATQVTLASGQALVGTPFAGGTLTTALNEAPIQNIAAASTMDLGATTTNTLFLTGSAVNISALGTAASGVKRTLINQVSSDVMFVNSSSLLLPSGADLYFSFGDIIQFVSRGGGAWSCAAFLPNSGLVVASYVQVGTIGNTQAQVDISANSVGNPRAAPLKFHPGINMLDPEDGAFEYDGTHLYFSIGNVRKTITLT